MEPGKKRSYGGSCAERECAQRVVREWQQQQEARSVVVQELAGRGVQYIGALPSQLACGGGGQGFGGTGVCHQRRRVLPTTHPCPSHRLTFLLLPSFALIALEESEAHPLLISKTLPTLFCLAICTYLIFCAQPASHAAHCSSATAHSPHHRLISSAFSCRKTSNLHLTYPYPAQNPPCRQLSTNRVWRSSREVGREMSWRRNGGARTQHSKRCVIFGLVF